MTDEVIDLLLTLTRREYHRCTSARERVELRDVTFQMLRETAIWPLDQAKAAVASLSDCEQCDGLGYVEQVTGFPETCQCLDLRPQT